MIRAAFALYYRMMKVRDRVRGRRGLVFVNKSAMLTFMLDHVVRLFPGARFIHIYRDGRPVALSYARLEWPKIEADRGVFTGAGYDFSFDEVVLRCAQS